MLSTCFVKDINCNAVDINVREPRTQRFAKSLVSDAADGRDHLETVDLAWRFDRPHLLHHRPTLYEVKSLLSQSSLRQIIEADDRHPFTSQAVLLEFRVNFGGKELAFFARDIRAANTP